MPEVQDNDERGINPQAALVGTSKSIPLRNHTLILLHRALMVEAGGFP